LGELGFQHIMDRHCECWCETKGRTGGLGGWEGR
jgi:hypothetical protein